MRGGLYKTVVQSLVVLSFRKTAKAGAASDGKTAAIEKLKLGQPHV
jgi:hypothetical protein